MSGFREGELILSSVPYAFVLDDKDRDQYCEYCFLKNDELKKCAQCLYIRYCSKTCQANAWKMHKTECKFLKSAGVNKPPAMTRFFALVLLKLKKYGYEEPFEKVGDRKVSMASLKSHVEELKKFGGDAIMTPLYTELKNFIGSDNVPPLTEFAQIFGKIHINMFKVEPDDGPDGLGLYLGASIFDHSCDPDAVYVFDGTILKVRMIKNVPHRVIDQVRISYCNAIRLREERRKRLWQSKFFLCACTMCSSSKMDDLLTKLVDDNPETKEKARKCKQDVEDLLKNGPTIKEPQLLYDKSKMLLKSQSGVLADTNIYRLRTLEKLLGSCKWLGKFEESVKVASLLEKSYRMYYSKNHPNLGMFLYEYGMSLCFTERCDEGIPILSEAEKILKVAYGEKLPVVVPFIPPTFR